MVGAEDTELENVAYVSSGILNKYLDGISKIKQEGILELVPIGIRGVIPEGITVENSSCGVFGVSYIRNRIFVKTFSEFISQSDQEVLIRLEINKIII